MLKQVDYTYNSADPVIPNPNLWYPFNVAGYDTIAITIESASGWDGEISFWAGAGADELSPALWSLNDAENASSTAVVYNVVGATPNYFSRNYRGSVAGLAEFGIWCASPTTYQSAIGIIHFRIGLYSSAK